MTRANRYRELRHARIYARWLHLPAWQSLSGDAAKLLCAMLAHFNPGRNGLEDFSARQAGEAMGKSKAQGARALLELEEKGWITVVRVGKFQARNKPSRYALAIYENDATGEPATFAFEHWTESGGDSLA